MSSLDWKKNVEDSIKDGIIITATTTAIFFVLKASNDIYGCNGCDKTCRWNNKRGIGEGICSLQKMDQRIMGQHKFYGSFEL